MGENLKKYLLGNGQTIFRETLDGRRIRIAVWKTKKNENKGTVFFLSGHREFIEKYSETFSLFLQFGLNVATLDWRGWGLSERAFPLKPKIQHISSAAEYQLDLDTVIGFAKNEKLIEPWYLVAHSLGCLIGLRRLLLEPKCFHKYIFMSPLWGNVRFLPKTIQRLLLRYEKQLKFLQLTRITNQNPKKYKPYSLTVDFKDNTLTSDQTQFKRLQTILKENTDLHSGTPTLGYLIAILKEIDELNKCQLPNRKILVLLAEKEQITDNHAVKNLTKNYEFIEVKTIEKAQHEILIEKEKIKGKAISLIYEFIKSK